jgi:hypothetical protein
MRRVVAVAAAISLPFALGAPASAGPPVEEVFDWVSFNCELSGEPGSGFVFIELFVGPEGGTPFAEAVIWLPGSDPFVDPPDLFSDFEGAVAEIDEDEVSALTPMVFAESGEPDGTLTVQGTIGELIDEESFSERFREGNRWVELTEETQFFDADAEVTLDMDAFETACTAERSHLEFRSTNPQASRVDFEDAFIECFGLIGSDRSTLNLFAGEFESEAFVSLEIFPADADGEFEPPPELFGSAVVGRLSGTINVSIPLFDPFNDVEPVTEAQVSMTVSEGETSVSDIVSQDGRVKETQTELLVSGTAQLALDGRSYNLDGCFGSRSEARGILNEAEGPKVSGPPPSNDTPDAALPLDIGGSATQQTKAAALDPEVACSFVFEDEEFEEIFDLPIGKTVWYTVEGTGEPIAISTAGSHFDTALGVYTSDGGNFEQVECVDDVFDAGFSLQAEVTFESEPGQTYFLQAGGFGLFEDPEFPEFSSLPEYGLLKIAVSGSEGAA